jgi:hypothetical protein
MAGGPTITVRQIASYPQAAAGPNDLVLLQQGGQGGPYATATLELLLNPLAQGDFPLSVGWGPGPASRGGQLFTNFLSLPPNGAIGWNAYLDGQLSATVTGVGAVLDFNPPSGLTFAVSPSVAAGSPLVQPPLTLLNLTTAGSMSLPLGTLAVGRDPAAANEVATLGWVGANTVASFNNRRGVVTLNAGDIYGALGICPPDTIATMSCVNEAICAAINDALRMHPGVYSWMGRVGDVFLSVADMNFAAANNPSFMPVLTIPEPPVTAIDGEVVTASWVLAMLATWSGGGNPPFATEAWVLQQIQLLQANVVTSFNNRLGAVSLLLSDITTAGGAPLASPNFSGIPAAPTAAPGTATAQLATTAFVEAAVTAAVTGVVSFNGRTGAVTLSATDLNNAGGALLASPNFTGTPAAPTAPAGTSSSQIATTAFVMNEITQSTGGVVSFNGRSGVVALQLADITGAGGAPQASPAFSGVPTAPTAANGTATQQLATTAFVMNEIAAISAGVTSFNGRSGAVTLTANDVTAVGGLTNPSPALTGTPTAPTPAPTDSSTNIATTAFVHAAVASAAGATVSPTAPPTPQTGTLWFNTSASPPLLNVWQGSAWLPTTNTSAYAPLASPALTGSPTAPTATPATTSTTQIATTAFVQSAVQAAIAAIPAGVTSWNGRTGAVTFTTTDLTGAGGATAAQLAGYLPLTGGTISGSPGTLTVAGQLQSNTQLVSQASGSNGGWVGSFAAGAITNIGFYANGNTLVFGNATAAGAPNTTRFTIDGSGNGSFTGSLAATSTSITGTITGGGLSISGGSTLAGVNCGGLTSSAAIQSNLGRFISYNAGNNPSVSCYDGNSGTNVCMFNQTSRVNWGSADGTGAPTGGWGWLNSAGNMFIAGTLSQGSDATTKNTIAAYARGVSIAAQLAPKTFIYNNDPEKTQHLGFVAQDVQPLIPDAVGENPAFNPADPPTLTLDPTAIIAVLANAVKQLISRIEALETFANIVPTAAETA